MISIGQSVYKDIDRVRKAMEYANRVFPSKWKKALDDAGDIAQKYFGRQFATEGSEFGTKWQDLAPSTQKDRKRKGYKPAHPILVRRGWLRASVVKKTSANHKREVTIGGIKMMSTLKTKSGLNLLMLHQDGGTKLPARKIYGEKWISEAGWSEIKTRFMGMFLEIRIGMEGRR